MSDSRKGPTAFARDVAETTRQYLTDLKGENDALRQLTDLLKDEKQRLEVELARQQVTRAELAQKLDGIQAQHHHLTNRYVQVEKQTTELAQLYVASARLHEHPERKEVLLAIDEIVTGIIGSEQFGVFEVEGGRTLTLVASMGIDRGALASLPLGGGVIGELVESGTVHVVKPGESTAETPGMTVCIPLIVGSAPIGAIVIFALLPQKAAFAQSDFPIFELLGQQAALALYFSGLHETRRGGPR